MVVVAVVVAIWWVGSVSTLETPLPCRWVRVAAVPMRATAGGKMARPHPLAQNSRSRVVLAVTLDRLVALVVSAAKAAVPEDR